MRDALDLSHTEHDNTISRLIRQAAAIVENDIHRSIVKQQRRLWVSSFTSPNPNYISLDFGPVISISSIKYRDPDNAEQTLSSSVYELDSTYDRLRLAYGQSWPSVLNHESVINIDYYAGFFDETSSPVKTLPAEIEGAMYMLIKWMFDHEGKNLQFKAEENPAYTDMLGPYMVKLL